MRIWSLITEYVSDHVRDPHVFFPVYPSIKEFLPPCAHTGKHLHTMVSDVGVTQSRGIHVSWMKYVLMRDLNPGPG